MDNDKVKEYLKNKEKQMEECQHLFLKIKEGKMIEEIIKYFLKIRDDVVKEHLFISNLTKN